MLKILINNLRLYGFHGVHDHEKENGQYFVFNIEIMLADQNVESDEIGATVNYSEAIRLLKKINEENKYDLLETLSEVIAKNILEVFNKAQTVVVRVEKENPPITEDIKSVGVEYSASRVSNGENIVYLALGSNLEDRKANILKALSYISREKNIRILKSSSIYESEPMYLKKQPSFYNSVLKAAITSDVNPFVLLGILKNIEYLMGRDDTVEKNGPRIIDIDILFYSDYRINTNILTIPHPKITERNFVLKPIEEIDPDFLIGKTAVKDLLREKAFSEKVIKVFDI